MNDEFTVEEAAQIIASPLKYRWPQQKGRLYDLLRLVEQYAWKKGYWLGQTKDYKVQVRSDGTLINPPGYSVLLKVNLNGDPRALRGSYFQFHRNANGSLPDYCGRNWSDDVVDEGLQPVIYQPSMPDVQSGCYTRRVKIGAFSTCSESTNQVVTVYGRDMDGDEIYTYRRKDATEVQLCGSAKVSTLSENQYEITQGFQIPITNQMFIADTLFIGEITAIRKPVTNGRVRVVANVKQDNSVETISEMEPHHVSSCYRRWRVPRVCCEYPTVHGLWKINKPGAFAYDNQLMLINDEGALLNLAQGLDLHHFKDSPVEAQAYLLSGITALTDDEEQHNPDSQERPMEVEDHVHMRRNERINGVRFY